MRLGPETLTDGALQCTAKSEDKREENICTLSTYFLHLGLAGVRGQMGPQEKFYNRTAKETALYRNMYFFVSVPFQYYKKAKRSRWIMG